MATSAPIFQLPALIDSLAEQFHLITPDLGDIRSTCRKIRKNLQPPVAPADRRLLLKLPALLGETDTKSAAPVLKLLGSLLCDLDRPWQFLRPLLEAQDPDIAARGWSLTAESIEAGHLKLNRGVLRSLARIMENEDGPLVDHAARRQLRDLLQEHYRAGKSPTRKGLDPLLRQGSDPDLRLLAATLLDLDESPPDKELSRRLLGPSGWRVLAPFLAYSRATHRDLVNLCGPRGARPAMVESFRQAAADHGEAVVRLAVSALGWERVNQGLRVEALVALHWPGVPPLHVRPEEADLFATETATPRDRPCHLVTARGGTIPRKDRQRSGANPVDRFRRMNIIHAELLSEILETGPPSRAKIQRILDLMDAVTADFGALFGDLSPQYQALPDIWTKLRDQAAAGLAVSDPGGGISPALTRLVLAFEDPRNLGEVRTIHGLKRFLHQEGLKLGFSIVNTDQSPNQTVELLLLPDQGDPVRGPILRFTEFEPDPDSDSGAWLPLPVTVAAEGLGWQLLQGHTAFPAVEIFIFGNEVQYYLYFRNHPAFLRVDFSPPQRGGMLDLEYYGVSNYEIDAHPDLKLGGVRRFYRAMGLDVRAEETRLFVRYDKERCSSLADLVTKVAGLFRFVPFMMDLDWQAASVQLPEKARQVVLDAWAERFRLTGVLPLDDILTRDRRHILLARNEGPAGEVESVWSGQGAYSDCLDGRPPASFWTALNRKLAELDLPLVPVKVQEQGGPFPLLAIVRHVLEPVRRRVISGQLEIVEGRLALTREDLFRPEHETERTAQLLAKGGAPALKAVALARPLSCLDKFLPFETTGQVGALKIEQGRLPLRGGDLRVFVARDRHGVIRFGFYTLVGETLALRRARRGVAWRSNALLDGQRLWALLRGANYVGDEPTGAEDDPGRDLTELQDLAHLHLPVPMECPEEAAQILPGLPAAPGRAVGRAVFGTAGRLPEDLTGAILVTGEVRPADGPYLFQSSGVISTGGAVLSHAALLAVQFGKPAMLAEGRWTDQGTGPCLEFTTSQCRITQEQVAGMSVSRRTVVARRPGRLVEGDLLVLDAGRGRVLVLGQEPETLILWQGFQLLARSQVDRDRAAHPREILEMRAQLLRALHQIRKAVQHLQSPSIAGFALEEIITGRELAGWPVAERAELVGDLLANPAVGEAVSGQLKRTMELLADRCAEDHDRCRLQIPTARFMFEVLGLRLRCLRSRESLDLVRKVRKGCDFKPADWPDDLSDRLPAWDDTPFADRLKDLRRKLLTDLPTGGPETRHRLRQLERLDKLLPGPHPGGRAQLAARRELEEQDAKLLKRLGGRQVLTSRECGLEAQPLIGGKGANLGEMDRLAGAATVPPWFAVTDAALQRMLALPAARSVVQEHLGSGELTLGQSIDRVLKLPGAKVSAQARIICQLWTATAIPEDLAAAVTEELALLQGDLDREIFVALRSSFCDEDTENAMQAGVYDTFLFVQGRESVLEHLRLAWAGLWTERALHARLAAGEPGQVPSGGVVIQRMVASRASGVLQTVNLAGGNLGEMVISAGLGLGEGIVSGQAAADLITVVKDQGPDSDPVHIKYLTNDKPRQVVFDQRAGRGTRLVETLYHQRLRPALEYTELCELARKAMTLEKVYGYPLDLEFALEDDRLWLLQARPIATLQAEYLTTLDRYPLQKQAGRKH